MNLNRKLLVIASAVLVCMGLAATVPVLAVDPPSISGVEITPDPAYTDTDLVAVPTGWTNDDPSEEAYYWQWEVDSGSGFLEIEGATTDTLANSYFDFGNQVRVTCTPYDEADGEGIPWEDTITISGGIVSIDPSPAYVDTDLTAVPEHWVKTGEVEPTFSYQWAQWDSTISAWVDISGETSAALSSTGFAVADQYRVACSADGGDPVYAETEIMGGIVEITPDPAYIDTDLTAEPLHWGDTPPTFTYEWSQWIEDPLNPGTWIWSPVGTGSILPSTSFAVGDQYQVECTPDGGTAVYDSITISNRLPSVDSVSITPDPAYTNSTLLATPTGWSDPDGDTADYQWQWQKWNGTEFENIPSANADTLDNTNFVLGDRLQVVCTPYDGTDTGDPVTAETTITAFNYDAGVDVKPGSDVNPVNLKSKGVIPVAILTTEGFDAAEVDVSSVEFGPGGASPVHSALEDVDEDGDIDLILHFRTQSTGIAPEDTTVTLTGETTGGLAFTGTNPIKIVPAKSQAAVQGNDDAPGAENGKENAPGQIKEPGEPADGKGKSTAPGQNKDEGKSATGKAKGKNK